MNGWTLPINKLPAYKAFKMTWTETLDRALMQRIYELPNDTPHFNKRNTFAIQKIHLKKLIDRMNGDELYVEAYQAKGIGRHYPKSAVGDDDKKNGISVICLGRQIKHTILKACGWTDIDMCAAHPSILFGVAKLNKRDGEFPILRQYVSDKKPIINAIKEAYSLPEAPLEDDDVKNLLSAYAYGGGFERWKNDEDIPEIKNIPENELLIAFREECRKGIDLVYANNPLIVDKIKDNKLTEWDIKKRTFSYWCGAIENDILFIIYKYLLKEGICGDKQGAKEYDGLCFKPLREFNADEVCNEISGLVRDEWKIDIKFKFKDYDCAYEFIPVATEVETEVVEVEAEAVGEYDMCETYDDYKEVFERSHCKIINKANFIKLVKDADGTIKEFLVFTKKDLVVAYEHLSYGVPTKKGVVQTSFITEWLKDKKMQMYDDIGCYPPPLVCPKGICNIWTPFRAQELPEVLEEKRETVKEGVKKLIKHIRILCNGEEKIYTYLIKWIAQMLKYPALKTTAPCLISEEGSGKGTLIEMLKALMGKKKVLITTEPEKYVWGNFNELMLNAFLVSLNEMDAKSEEKAEGVIKALITDGDLLINPKGKGHINTQSYHRFIRSSNNKVPLKSKKGDRRNMVVKCSDELKGKSDYFADLYALINDDQVIKGLYDYLIGLEGLDEFHKEPVPLTNYQQTIQEGNRDALEIFMEQFIYQRWLFQNIRISCKDLLAEFENWRHSNNITYQTSSIKMMRNLGLMGFPEGTMISEHTNKGNFVDFDMAKLKQHFKLTAAPAVAVETDEVETEDEGF